jgi:hypothetical protein
MKVDQTGKLFGSNSCSSDKVEEKRDILKDVGA